MIRKRKQKSRLGFLLFLIFIVACAALVAQYREKALGVWKEVKGLAYKPDIAAIMARLKREPWGIYCTDGEVCYLFDKDGVLFGTAQTVVGDVIVKIEDASDFKPALNQPFLEGDDWENAALIIESLKKKEFSAEGIILLRAEREVRAVLLPERIPVYFSLEFDPRAHIGALPALRQKVPFKDVQYLDMRVEGKIFYK